MEFLATSDTGSHRKELHRKVKFGQRIFRGREDADDVGKINTLVVGGGQAGLARNQLNT